MEIFSCQGLTCERAEGKKLEVEVADTAGQEELRQRYLAARDHADTLYIDPIKKFTLFVGGLKVRLVDPAFFLIADPDPNPGCG
jgi:hypothetical protein